MPKSWYVAITDYKREIVAERALRVAGFEAFNPRCKSTALRWGKKVAVIKPYVPGYIFVRFDVVRCAYWQDVNRVHGVKRLLCNSPETPTRLRANVMAELFERCDGQVIDACILDEIALKHMPIGSRVRVLEGPFAGFEATVELSTPQRLAAIVMIFGRPTSLDLDMRHAEPV